MNNIEDKPIVVAQIMGKWVGGGVEAVIMNYYRHIDRSKIQFDFICDEDSTNIPYEEIEQLGGRVIICPPYQKIFKYEKFLIDLFKKNKYKIVHSNINTLSVFPLRAAKKAGVPIRIAHNHATSHKKEFKRNVIKMCLKPFSKLYATVYMCCSEKAGRWMFGNKDFDNNKVVLIKNAINIDSFIFNNKIRDEYKEKLGIKENELVIGHIGRLVSTKNHSFLLKVFAEINKERDSVLLIIGQGPLEKEIRNQVDEFGLKQRVIFLGQKKDINNYYQIIDAFILPSLYEGFGMTLLEAQASNLPCVASTEVPKEVKLINDFEFIPLDSDIKKWSKTVLKLLKKNERKSNKELLVNKGYDIIKEAKKLTDYYISLIEEESNANN